MFPQDLPPDTSGYMVAGYTIFFIIFGIYLLSLFIRARNFRQDLDLLENMPEKPRPGSPPKSRAARPAPVRKKAAIRKKS